MPIFSGANSGSVGVTPLLGASGSVGVTPLLGGGGSVGVTPLGSGANSPYTGQDIINISSAAFILLGFVCLYVLN